MGPVGALVPMRMVAPKPAAQSQMKIKGLTIKANPFSYHMMDRPGDSGCSNEPATDDVLAV
jgi:hypothetical protein